ncbi:hypothetical protein MAM1_0020d01730 [Mucor ambiguus]|uniref:Methyltransferase domain-containing protein n=1 Tax=Mucor ambiguus TaxID=91626 RepID=A0A0C9MGV4_9FUNG|nr:hypothetical protein MAM1_0020d01730 [Mucor ambiguus]
MTEDSALFSEETAEFYKEYTGLNDVQDLENHLTAIQQKLAKDLIRLGQTLEQQHQKPYFLDIGCCTGTDLRKMMLDGYPKDYLIGMDIEQCYIDCGYELFKDDPDICPIRFIIDDLFTFEKTHVLFNGTNQDNNKSVNMILNIAADVSFEVENEADAVDSRVDDNGIANAVKAKVIDGHAKQEAIDQMMLPYL